LLQSIIFIGVLYSLYLIISFMVKYKYKFFVVLLNIFFIAFCYIALSQMQGNSVPLDYKIPLFLNINELKNCLTIDYFTVSPDGKDIDLVIPYNGNNKLYSIKYNEKVINQMRAIQSASSGTGDKITLCSYLTKPIKNGTEDLDSNGQMYTVNRSNSHSTNSVKNPSEEGVEEVR
jgi:hypothetical protein